MEKEMFKIIMQLHGEGDTPSDTPAPQNVPSTEPAPEGGSSPAPANDNNDGGGSSSASQGGDNILARSEKGSFVVRHNPLTGMNEVVSTMPRPKEPEDDNDNPPTPAGNQQPADNTPQPAAQPQQQQQSNPKTEYAGDEMLKMMQQVQAGNMPQIQNQAANPTADYTAEELQAAMRAGIVDEARIPVSMRAGYYNAMARAQQQATQQQQQQAETQNGESPAKAQEFYQEVNRMARERAMQEIGITEDELNVAEYSTDEALVNKFNAYNAAVENNRAQILQAVDNIQRQQIAAQADSQMAYKTVIGFVNEMRTKNKDFEAIDKYMMERIDNMPHKEAAKIMPVIQRLGNGTLSTADIPVLQEMYNQARLEYYSRKTGVPLAPQVQKPTFVEAPGNGKEPPKQAPDLKALGTMNERDKRRAVGQLLGKMFLED